MQYSSVHPICLAVANRHRYSRLVQCVCDFYLNTLSVGQYRDGYIDDFSGLPQNRKEFYFNYIHGCSYSWLSVTLYFESWPLPGFLNLQAKSNLILIQSTNASNYSCSQVITSFRYLVYTTHFVFLSPRWCYRLSVIVGAMIGWLHNHTSLVALACFLVMEWCPTQPGTQILQPSCVYTTPSRDCLKYYMKHLDKKN